MKAVNDATLNKAGDIYQYLMKTIWVKQGFSAYQKPINVFQQADYAVDRLQDILEILK